ncbi:glucuronate isomerase [Selenomonas sp. ND2010]|uniref:glucuronate isomerase n=1 Tax=Selenomonas sp. ND2010 TaxID=1410618 RepID=UPI00051B4E94|nr:glucuronate isomerase [Selenomonas sp. ND2010]
MKKYIPNDVMLQTEAAKRLYHDYVASLPVIDYRTHLRVEEIGGDEPYRNLTQLMLKNSPEKWRLMRANGVEEKYITGEASDREKFQKFAETLPKAMGNPIYLNTHIELKRFFGCEEFLSGDTAEKIWNEANAKLKDLSPWKILAEEKVEGLGILADPSGKLQRFEQLRQEKACPADVVPVFCPDKALQIEGEEWENYMKYELGTSAGIEISTMHDIYEALSARMDAFAALGCCTADHTLAAISYYPAENFELDDIVGRTINGKGTPSPKAREQYQTALLLFLAKEYARRGWIMQLEYAVVRDSNTVRAQQLGPDKGDDCLSSGCRGDNLARFFDRLNREGKIPKTIISSRNPSDGALIASVIGAFQGSGVAGKLQLGGSWTFQGDKAGIEAQLANTANLLLLGNAIHMPSNARSLLSLNRHEYYRRILCNFVGRMVENGEYPEDWNALGKLMEDICYNNAKQYFAD